MAQELTLQRVMDVSQEFQINETEALAQARDLVNWPDKGAKWYRQCADYLKNLRNQEAAVEKELDPLRAQAFKTYQGIKDLMTRLINPRKRCRELVSREMSDWKRGEDTRRQAEAAATLSINIKSADDERLAAAEQLASTGNHLLAEAILADAGCAQIPATQEVKVDGITHKKKWVARVINKRELLHEVEKRPELTDCLDVNMKWLAREKADYVSRGKPFEVAGILFEEEETVSVRKDS